MTISDILSTLQWWFTLFVLGIGFLPVTFLVFKNFFDKGYLFSKILAVAITSYSVLLLGLFHIAPFTFITCLLVFLGTITLLFFFLRKKQNLLAMLKQSWKVFLFEELLFITALFFWTYIHTFSPDIHGLEKYMDFGFINSILRSSYFPPKDMWFPPDPINYYYFGHLMTAVVTKLSHLPSNLTFNLMLATIFTFCFTQAFSIAANLYTFMTKQEKFLQLKRCIAGILSASLVTFAGNLHILYAFFKAYPNESPVPFWQLPFLPLSFPNAYWYPNATRFIHNTIHEFPMYSWTVADLHGHVLDIPVVLLIIAALFSIFIQKNQQQRISKVKSQISKNFIENWKLKIGNSLLIGFLLAVAYMTNAWDGGIYLLLTILVLWYLYWQKEKGLEKFFSSVLIVIIGFVIFVLPFNMHFKASSLVSGIGVLCSPDFLVNIKQFGPLLFEKNHCQHSPGWQLLTLYGFFYFFVLSFLVFAIKVKKLLSVDIFVLLLIILSTLLIMIPEFFYMKDIYPAHYRANTMFKLAFQAFIMLSLASGYIIVRIISGTKKLFAICSLPFAAILVSLVMLYPFQAVNSYYNNLQNPRGLDGTKYLKTLHPGDYEAIIWLNKNVKGQPVILEAQGDSYTDFARISANTGLPTILGWTVHEWLWRGTYDIPAPRIEEVKTIYTTNETKKAVALLKKYKVQYVIVGKLEYQQYPKLEEKKFSQLGKIVFQKEETKIYHITAL